MGLWEVTPFREHATFSKLEAHHQIQYNVILWTLSFLFLNTADPQSSPCNTFKIKKELGVCLPQDQFEEYGRDNHIGARA